MLLDTFFFTFAHCNISEFVFPCDYIYISQFPQAFHVAFSSLLTLHASTFWPSSFRHTIDGHLDVDHCIALKDQILDGAKKHRPHEVRGPIRSRNAPVLPRRQMRQTVMAKAVSCGI